jgi:hypothetical protein
LADRFEAYYISPPAIAGGGGSSDIVSPSDYPLLAAAKKCSDRLAEIEQMRRACLSEYKADLDVLRDGKLNF